MIADDIIAGIKQDISSLRFEMREYRRKDASREVIQMQLLRDVTAEIRKAAAVRRQNGSASAEGTPAAATQPQGGAIAPQGKSAHKPHFLRNIEAVQAADRHPALDSHSSVDITDKNQQLYFTRTIQASPAQAPFPLELSGCQTADRHPALDSDSSVDIIRPYSPREPIAVRAPTARRERRQRGESAMRAVTSAMVLNMLKTFAVRAPRMAIKKRAPRERRESAERAR
ncbi:Hypp3546 [Branchiostoma lanceolatum]|uniref:Hypp3546 protein n=1 Tax=Branchiostoma lanceolatum TaxID=7740 RepID=A0A8K0A279_BRALA|nr:Hypp3546 [Branchiostoma lanceolatum]